MSDTIAVDVYHYVEMPGPAGLQGSAMSFLLFFAWTALIKGMFHRFSFRVTI